MGIKFPTPWKTLIIKFPPPWDGKGVKCPGYARGGMLKLRFDRYISHEFNTIVVGTEGKILNVHVVVLLTAPQTKVLGEQEPHGLYQ